jgi:galactofuranose transport system permease protein
MTPSTLSASAPGADRPLASVGSAPGSSTSSSPGAPPDISPGASPGPSAGHGRKRAHPLVRWLHHPAFSSQMTVVLLVLLLTVGGVLYDGFAAPQVMLNLLIDNAYLLVLAVGMSLVILSGGIDLSVGAVLALSTTVAAWLLHKGQWPAPVVMGVVLAGGTLFGVMQGALIHLFRLQPFIVTLAGMFLARGLCYLISVDSITISDETFVQISQMQIPLPGGFLSPGAVMALMLLAVGIWLAHRSGFGRAVYALGGNESSALMMGLPVGRTKLMVYGFSGFCASLAGLLFGFYMLSGYGLHAQGAELDAIAAVVIGGTMLSGGYGYVAGALSGVLVLGTIQTLIAFDGTLSSWWTKIVIGGLLFVFCVVQRLLSRPLAGSAPGAAPMG